MKINGREIGPNHPPYVIAEISANHNGSLDRALRLIDAAKHAGADAVKFQCYEASTITLDCDGPSFMLEDGPWKGKRLYDLYREAQTPFAWFPVLFERARAVAITAFSSVFDHSSIDLLESLGCPAYKIASFELIDLPLIRYAASTGKPIILSTGMGSDDEISAALNCCRGNTAVLHAISGYPTPAQEADLSKFLDLKRYCNVRHGISDHTTGIEIPIAATALGASILEKHLKLDRARTVDSAFSIVPNNFKAMVDAVRNTWAALQPSQAHSEQASRPLRRSLYAVADIPAGAPFTNENVRSIRPGHGLPPAMIDDVIGKTAARAIARGEPMTAEAIVRMTRNEQNGDEK